MCNAQCGEIAQRHEAYNAASGESLRCSDEEVLVFVTRNGRPLEARNVQRDFRKVVDVARLAGREWAPRELRHSFVPLLSDANVPVGDITSGATEAPL